MLSKDNNSNKKNITKESCCNCRYWFGPGIDVDHSHCAVEKTKSKYGNKEYDICLSFKVWGRK